MFRETGVRGSFILLTALLGLSCGGQGGSEDMCSPGRLGCPCDMGLCLSGLECEAGVCVGGSSDTTMDGTGEEGSTDSSTDSSTGDPTETDSETTDPSTTSTTDEMCGDGEISCDDQCVDPETDDAHCGACGNSCIIGLDAGGCAGGECQPYWSECTIAGDPLLDCNQVCFNEGSFCSAESCNGGTARWYGAISDCQDNVGSNGAAYPSCTQPEIAQDFAYRCCCQQ